MTEKNRYVERRDVNVHTAGLGLGLLRRAGPFGFERAVRRSPGSGDRVLFPAVRAPAGHTDCSVCLRVCREQIVQSTGRKAVIWRSHAIGLKRDITRTYTM